MNEDIVVAGLVFLIVWKYKIIEKEGIDTKTKNYFLFATHSFFFCCLALAFFALT
jgi:hypothetical protein